MQVLILTLMIWAGILSHSDRSGEAQTADAAESFPAPLTCRDAIGQSLQRQTSLYFRRTLLTCSPR